jgi:hypothetical protein
MVRPDATAELLGVAGFFLSESRSWPGRLAGVALLVLAVLTKQTALIFLLAAALAAGLSGQWRRALGVLGGGLGALFLAVVAVNTLLEPHFARSLVGEMMMPWEFNAWRSLLGTVVQATPDLLFLPVVGLVLWLTDRPRDVRLASLAAVLLAAALGLSGKVGADLNYYLSLRVAEASAVGALWHALHATEVRSRARSAALAAVTALAIVSVVPGILAAMGQARFARRRAASYEGPVGRLVLHSYRAAIAQARNPDVRLLTDTGLIDLYQGERAAFGDPWLFRKLVELGRIEPATIRNRLDAQYYDLIITTNDLGAPEYAAKDFRLPMVLAERARARYALKGVRPGLFFYGRRPGGGSAVAEQAGGLGR